MNKKMKMENSKDLLDFLKEHFKNEANMLIDRDFLELYDIYSNIPMKEIWLRIARETLIREFEEQQEAIKYIVASMLEYNLLSDIFPKIASYENMRTSRDFQKSTLINREKFLLDIVECFIDNYKTTKRALDKKYPR